jgi:uncharacterized protein with HEPN domain
VSKRLAELALFDILIASLKIEYVVNRFADAEELRHDFMAWDSVVREFEVIGEAMRILIESGTFGGDRRAIVDFRNVLIHEYFGIDAEELWKVATIHLPQLRGEIVEKIKTIDQDLKQELLADLSSENRHLDFVLDALAALK